MRIKSIIILVILIQAISCKKDDTNSRLEKNTIVSNELSFSSAMDAFLSLVGFFNVQVEGDLIIQDNHAINNLNPQINNISAGFGISGISDLDINNGSIEIEADEHGEFHHYSQASSNIYGNDLLFSFRNTDNDTIFSDTIYVPNRMIAIFRDSIVNVGDTIYWNADNNNSIGVGVVIYFNDEKSVEFGGKYSGSDDVLNYELFSDNGFLVFNSSLLSNIPDSSVFTIEIGRGNWVTSQSKIDPFTDSLNTLVFSMAFGYLFYDGN